MTEELRLRNQSQQLYVRALSQVYRNSVQLFDPSMWLVRDPEAEEKMLRDADIAHAIDFRRKLIAGRQWQLTPRVERSPVAELAVEVGTELLGGISHFTRARLNLARAFFSGSRFARIHGEPRNMTIGDGKPRTWWVPVRLEDEDKRIYRPVPELKQQEGTTDVALAAHWERWNVANQRWDTETRTQAMHTIRHVYEDDQATLGFGRALREALGWVWYFKTEVMQETLQAVEKFAQGTLHAKVDMLRDADTNLPNPTLVEEWVSILEDMRSRHVIVSDKSDDIEIIQGNAEGWQLLEVIEEKLKNKVITLVLGANLPTTATEGGSYALGGIQENSTEMLIQYDRESLEETLTDDLLGCVWHKNRPNLVELGIVDEKPRFSIAQEKREDPEIVANVAQQANAMGLPLAKDELYEKLGFRKPEEGEDILEGGTAQPIGGIPGFGFKGGD